MNNGKVQRITYFLIFQENMYKVDPIIFEKMSEKFKNQLESFPKQMFFEDNVSLESFKVFLSACQLKPFTIESNIALEVLEISRKWGVPSLEQFTLEYCQQNNIKYRPKEDFIGILIDNIENNIESTIDLENVSNIINEAFDDDRFFDIEPEILYRIIILAEKKGFDEIKFINFVMKLFDIYPETAVLLSLRLNFDQLNEEQIDKIFQCAEMHSISIGFFVAFSISAIRNKTKYLLFESDKHHIESIDLFQRELDFERRKLINFLDEEHNQTMNELMDKIMKQHEKIEYLSDILSQQAEVLDTGSLSTKGIGDENLRKIKESTDLELSNYKINIDEQLNEKLNLTFNNISNIISTIRTEREAEIADPTKVREETARLVQLGEEKSLLYENESIKIDEELDNLKAALGSKIVKDYLRFNKGMRSTQDKFKVFDLEPNIWGLNSNKVSNQNQIIKELEKRLEELCPIRGGLNDKNSIKTKSSNTPSLLEDTF